MHHQGNHRRAVLRHTTLAMAMGMCLAGAVHAQSTTGTIFGQAPAGTNEVVTITGTTGVSRQVPVDATGRYRAGNLPLGTYTVSLQRDGTTVETRNNVNTIVGQGTEVSFAGPTAETTTSLSAVTVTAASVPAIDVTSVDSRSVITSQQLAKLPLARNAEAIALLAPGAVQGSGNFANGNTVSFGGAGVTENAYYLNGYNSSDPLKNLGGVGLPYGAIDQQETYTGGYSAKYGRSDGGVISQVGKRGTNDWHFGAQVLWEPKFLASDPKNIKYADDSLPPGYGYADPTLAGTPYRDRKDNRAWTTTYSAYVGGPLIKDKLFLFVAAEAEKTEGMDTSGADAAIVSNNHYTYNDPKWYAKLDWNINDSNILELTAVGNRDERQGSYYDYDYATHKEGGFAAYADSTKLSSRFYIGKYTSYITDDLTVTATLGKSKVDDYLHNPAASPLPLISNPQLQDPLITGGDPITNNQSSQTGMSPDAGSRTHGTRIDVDYQLGSHHLALGIDNMSYHAHNEGQVTSGPGYLWIYGHQNDPTKPISTGLGIPGSGGRGYYVQRYIFEDATSMSVDQKAEYIEDTWQVTDTVMVKLGVRNDKFTNSNNLGDAYVKSGNQYAPRFGFTWDVFGDSTMKVFGNLGRYYLALPNSVAIRGASSSTYTRQYFTYTGIDANGAPTGLTDLANGPVSSDNEFGQPTFAKAVAASDLKSQYQDEAILGIEKAWGPEWVTGAKVTVRKLQAAIDDVCDSDKLLDKYASTGGNPDTLNPPGCVIFNPGKTNTFNVPNVDGGYTKVKMSRDDWGFAEGAKRKYAALDLFAEHPYDGKWWARLDYTFSRSYGNTEGQVKSDIGQTDVSKTQDWDAATLMEYSSGLLANNRKHQIKLNGAYSINEEWTLGATVQILSGTPKSCLGFYFDGTDPIGYGSSYHVCNNVGSPPGASGNEPWTKRLDLALSYRPAFADHKLNFAINVFNVFNERKERQSDPVFEGSPSTVSNTYGQGIFFESPRYARLSASYDF
jgi:hypothetical protein